MRWMGTAVFLVVWFATAAVARQDLVKDGDGKTIAVIYDCNRCESPTEGRDCASGVEAGYSDGKVCGECLLNANFGVRIPYGADIFVTGHLKDEAGNPVEGKFVKLKLPNTWGYRTRTIAKGFFRLALGATIERTEEKIRVDLGDRTMSSEADTDYMLYMLPPDHKPCPTEAK